jgi:hypothetical protein
MKVPPARYGITMLTHQVNLDSLIQREPLDSESDAAVTGHEPLFKLEELHRTKMYFRLLRKPDFQRETANWPPAMIVEFVKTFLDGGLIPSIIVWHSKKTNNVFTIDGAHRVSALIAWVNDDYGNGEISQKAWDHAVPQAHQNLHAETKRQIDSEIGSYVQLYDFGLDPEKTEDPDKRRRGKAIATMQLSIQRVDGDASVAEESFYKINSSAVGIDDTELNMIRGRRLPNAIATRAILSKGKGYKYWKRFGNAIQIETLAANAYDLLFGELLEIGPKSPDLPRAGQPYSSEAFKMVLDFVNLFNDVTPAMWTHRTRARAKNRGKAQVAPRLPDDTDGTATVRFLEHVIDIATLVSGPADMSQSLGLDQAVYAYDASGKIHAAAFIAHHRFIAELKEKHQLSHFTIARSAFEEFLVRHKDFLNVLGHSKGSRIRPLEAILTMYRGVFEAIGKGITTDIEIVKHLEQYANLDSINSPVTAVDGNESEEPITKKFSKAAVRAKVVSEILATRARCAVCSARLPPSCRSKDHIQKVEDEGMGSVENLQFTHPYCNSSREAIEKLRQEALP